MAPRIPYRNTRRSGGSDLDTHLFGPEAFTRCLSAPLFEVVDLLLGDSMIQWCWRCFPGGHYSILTLSLLYFRCFVINCGIDWKEHGCPSFHCNASTTTTTKKRKKHTTMAATATATATYRCCCCCCCYCYCCCNDVLILILYWKNTKTNRVRRHQNTPQIVFNGSSHDKFTGMKENVDNATANKQEWD